jgi:hypothetical protein
VADSLSGWIPKVLSEFEIGQAMAAIEGVDRLGKPMAEVGLRLVDPADLDHDLRWCISDSGARVFLWIRRHGERWSFGFYQQPWVLDAMDFLERADLPLNDRHWITGLLFGYQPHAIQSFAQRHEAIYAEEGARRG